MKKEAYVGIDVGKSVCAVCVMDEDGSILHEGKYPQHPGRRGRAI